MKDCIFCKIISREISTQILFEDDNFISFLDAHPVTPGHSLVVPKKHSTDVLDMDTADIGPLMEVAQHLAKTIKTVVSAPGMNINHNAGSAAGQVIFHTHFHIIPRFEKDGLTNHPHRDYPPEERQKKLAESIREKL